MTKGRLALVHKTIAFSAIFAVTLYLSYSAVLSAIPSADLCCFADENAYTAICCCDEDEPDSDCCYSEVPPQNNTVPFFVLLDRDSYRNNLCNVQIRASDSLILAELYGIIGEEQFTPNDITYFIFRPPKV